MLQILQFVADMEFFIKKGVYQMLQVFKECRE